MPASYRCRGHLLRVGDSEDSRLDPFTNHPWSCFFSHPKFGTCTPTDFTCGVQESTFYPTLPLHSATGHLEPSAPTHVSFPSSLVLDPALHRMEDSTNLPEALCWQLPEAISSSELLVSCLFFQNSLLPATLIPAPLQFCPFSLGRSIRDLSANVSQFCHYNCHKIVIEVLLSSLDLPHPFGLVL